VVARKAITVEAAAMAYMCILYYITEKSISLYDEKK
jgi:hypothetical protein